MPNWKICLVLGAALWPRLVSAQQVSPADSLRRDSLARFTLAPIDVTVTRAVSDMSHLPYAVQVVTGEQIGPGRTRLGLDEALAGVPGVLAANRQNYSLDQTLSIRGFGARSAFGVRGLKIILDGIPQTLPDGQGQMTNVDLDDVQRVEILRGSASSLYGNAAGGVISLSTEDTRPTRVVPEASFLSGAYGLLKYRAAVALPVGKGSLSVSGVRTTSDGYRIHSTADIRQARARLTAPFGPTTVTAVVQAADDPVIKDPGALTLAQFAADGRAANALSVTNDAGKDVNQTQAGITVAHQRPGGGLSATATVFGLKRHLSNPTNAAYIDLGRSAYGARGSLGVPVSVASRTAMLMAGADAQWQRDARLNYNTARTTLTRDQLERVAEFGPFVQATMDPLPAITVMAGGRYDRVRFAVDDHFQSDGDDSGVRIMSALSGSAGVAVHTSAALAPYANVSTSFETPTTTELANRPTGPGGFNPVLDPQKTVSYEIGVKGAGRAGQAGRAGGIRVDYSVAAYRANLRGELIPFEVPTDPTRRFFRNSGSSRHEGVEMGAGLSVGGVSLRGGYTYSRNTFTDFRVTTTVAGVPQTTVYDGFDEPGVPHHYFRGIATAHAGRFAWVSVEETVSSSFVVNDANTLRNANWAAMSVRGGANLDLAGWSVGPFAGVNNVFNKIYAASVQVNAANARYYEPAPTRNVYVGVEIKPR